MKFSRVRIIGFTFILSILALWFTSQQSSYHRSSQLPQTISPKFSWQSINSTLWQVDLAQPHQQIIIKTDYLNRHESGQQSLFTQPIITIHQGSNLTTIRSQQGQSLNDEIFILSGNVTITQFIPNKFNHTDNSSYNKTQINRLNTQSITYNAKLNTLSTDEKVTIKRTSGITRGTGLKVDLTPGNYQLISNVVSTFNIGSVK